MGVIRRTALSELDYLEIWHHIAEHSTDAADRMLRRFDELLKTAAEFPHIGRPRAELGKDLRTLPAGSYVVIYRPVEGGIELVRVLHGARDFQQIFKRHHRTED